MLSQRCSPKQISYCFPASRIGHTYANINCTTKNTAVHTKPGCHWKKDRFVLSDGMGQIDSNLIKESRMKVGWIFSETPCRSNATLAKYETRNRTCRLHLYRPSIQAIETIFSLVFGTFTENYLEFCLRRTLLCRIKTKCLRKHSKNPHIKKHEFQKPFLIFG